MNLELQKIPDDKINEADAVASFANNLISHASEEKPNPMMLKITGEGLKQAALSLANVLPTALEITTKITNLVSGLF